MVYKLGHYLFFLIFFSLKNPIKKMAQYINKPKQTPDDSDDIESFEWFTSERLQELTQKIKETIGPDDDDDENTPPTDGDGKTLSYEQKYAIQCVVDGKKNVFITGPAGTGKSYLLNGK
jgi:type IV secretory pathway ATPase VirB11/archaellum biosynthesis ATPase